MDDLFQDRGLVPNIRRGTRSETEEETGVENQGGMGILDTNVKGLIESDKTWLSETSSTREVNLVKGGEKCV